MGRANKKTKDRRETLIKRLAGNITVDDETK